MVEVYDIETLLSCFTYVGYDVKTHNYSSFVLHRDKFELKEFMNHLSLVKGGIGFNNEDFDYPVIHFIINNSKEWFENIAHITDDDDMIDYYTFIIEEIYDKAQDVINSKSLGEYPSIRDREKHIPQLDLFRINHYNNMARTQSLKGLQVAMGLNDVIDMPIHHRTPNITLEEVYGPKGILVYNKNDVYSTYQFYLKNLEKIELRKKIKKIHNIDCLNYPDTKIGEELVLKLYCEATDNNYWDIKKLRTNREHIKVSECIFDYVSFKSKKFNQSLNVFKNYIISSSELDEKKKEKKKKLGSCIYKGFKYDFGLGGIHGCIEPGVYVSDNEWVIIDADVECSVVTH